MKKISLNGTWTLSGRPEQTAAEPIRLNAAVPGLVQLDLSAAGILPEDLFMGMNIKETEKYEDWEWWYERTFTAPEERENVFIVFRGVDCIAEYFLNGEKFGESANMMIPFEFEIGHLLRDGENTVTVHISSPVVAAHKDTYDLFAIDVARRRTPVNTSVRRAIHSYGWDIMPRAVTHGLWRDVYLEVRDPIRFTQVFFDFSRPERPRFCFETESEWKDFKDVEIEVSASCGESGFSFRKKIPYKSGMFDFELNDPKLWWPLGYGEQPLYDAVLKIFSKGEPVHEYHTRFGVRTVELQRTDVTDGENGYFRFLVNGAEIMCKGSNWVPLDAFHSRDASRYAEALEMAKDLGCNVLRCWGGNVYEDHAFFDYCDENGIMIWQDFAMACYTYPQREEFYQRIREEAASVVREYRHHPSIILWSGDNEVDYAYMTGRDTRPSMNRVTREVLPEVVRVNDIGRPYLTGSPYVDDRLAVEKGINASEAHLWGARDYYKADFYKQSRAHFVSETGYHGCPSMNSIRKYITPEKVWPYFDNEEWNLHSADQDNWDGRIRLMHDQVLQLFGEVPTDPDKYTLASQISQAEAKKYFIERVRVDRPRKSGVIWWNLVDGWPQMSDAIVDYYFEKKLAYRHIKRSQTPFAVIADELADWNIRLYGCNDTLTEKAGHLRVWDADTEETLLDVDFRAAANTSTLIAPLRIFYSEKRLLIFDWEADGEKGRNHYLCGYPPFDFDRYCSWIEKGLI